MNITNNEITITNELITIITKKTWSTHKKNEVLSILLRRFFWRRLLMMTITMTISKVVANVDLCSNLIQQVIAINSILIHAWFNRLKTYIWFLDSFCNICPISRTLEWPSWEKALDNVSLSWFPLGLPLHDHQRLFLSRALCRVSLARKSLGILRLLRHLPDRMLRVPCGHNGPRIKDDPDRNHGRLHLLHEHPGQLRQRPNLQEVWLLRQLRRFAFLPFLSVFYLFFSLFLQVVPSALLLDSASLDFSSRNQKEDKKRTKKTKIRRKVHQAFCHCPTWSIPLGFWWRGEKEGWGTLSFFSTSALPLATSASLGWITSFSGGFMDKW